MAEIISLQEYRNQQPQPREEYLVQYGMLSDTNKWVVRGILGGLIVKAAPIDALYNMLPALDRLRVRQEINNLLLQEQKLTRGK